VNAGDPEVRLAVMKTLEAIGDAALPALPAVARELKQIDPRLRAEAARLIGLFGSRSRGYLPALTRLLAEPRSAVRQSASPAILPITEPEEKPAPPKPAPGRRD